MGEGDGARLKFFDCRAVHVRRGHSGAEEDPEIDVRIGDAHVGPDGSLDPRANLVVSGVVGADDSRLVHVLTQARGAFE